MARDIANCRDPLEWVILRLTPAQVTDRFGITFEECGFEDGLGPVRAARILSHKGRLFTLVYYPWSQLSTTSMWVCRNDVVSSARTLADELLEVLTLDAEDVVWQQDPRWALAHFGVRDSS